VSLGRTESAEQPAAVAATKTYTTSLAAAAGLAAAVADDAHRRREPAAAPGVLAANLDGVGEAAMLGVEAPLWTETLTTTTARRRQPGRHELAGLPLGRDPHRLARAHPARRGRRRPGRRVRRAGLESKSPVPAGNSWAWAHPLPDVTKFSR